MTPFNMCMNIRVDSGPVTAVGGMLGRWPDWGV